MSPGSRKVLLKLALRVVRWSSTLIPNLCSSCVVLMGGNFPQAHFNADFLILQCAKFPKLISRTIFRYGFTPFLRRHRASSRLFEIPEPFPISCLASSGLFPHRFRNDRLLDAMFGIRKGQMQNCRGMTKLTSSKLSSSTISYRFQGTELHSFCVPKHTIAILYMLKA